MAKRKTQYIVNFNADPNTVYQVVNNWLNANKFVYKEKYDTKYYQSGDGIWTTSRCFEYYFQGNQLIIYAYLKTPKNPFALDSGMVGSVNTTPYINLIKQLIEAIEQLPPAVVGQYGQMTNMQGQYGYAQSQQLNQVNSGIYAEAEKRNRNTAIGAFAVSIINVLILFVGYVYWLVLVFGFVLSVQAMQSKHKILAVTALILNLLVLIAFILIKAGIIYM